MQPTFDPQDVHASNSENQVKSELGAADTGVLTDLCYIYSGWLVAEATESILVTHTLDFTYPFHELCWVMLLARLGRGGESGGDDDGVMMRASVADCLYQILHCLPRTTGGKLLTEHLRHSPPEFSGAPLPNLAEEPPIPDETQGVDGAIADRVPDRDVDATSSSDPFTKLPPELVHIVLSLLSSPDVCSLRTSSRAVAACSRASELPSAFWASRFARDREMGFAFAHLRWRPRSREAGSSPGWRRLYRAYKTALRQDSPFLGIRLRRRIYDSLEHFAATLEPLLAAGGTREGGAHDAESVPRLDLITCRWLPSGGARLRDLIALGTRLKCTKDVSLLRARASGALVLKACLVRFDSRVYISALRVYTEDGHLAPGRNRGAGLITSVEDSFTLRPQDEITAIDVVKSIAGIRGLRFHINAPGENLVRNLGITDITDASMAVGRLSAKACVVSRLRLGFDVCTASRAFPLRHHVLSTNDNFLGLQGGIRRSDTRN